MIDEKVLLKEMNQMLHDYEDCGILPSFMSARDMVERQPRIDVPDTNVGKWIPVSERLPKQGEEVIATFENDKGKKVVCQEKFFPVLLKGVWPMIAWMPCPEPYKGE